MMLISAKSSIFKLALSLASASACEMVSDVYIQVGQNHSDVKIKIRELLLRRQKQGDQEEWDESNFSIR